MATLNSDFMAQANVRVELLHKRREYPNDLARIAQDIFTSGYVKKVKCGQLQSLFFEALIQDQLETAKSISGLLLQIQGGNDEYRVRDYLKFAERIKIHKLERSKKIAAAALSEEA